MVEAGATAYEAAEWHDLFVAVAGATAALLGLLFVAVSINLEQILKYEGLPERALETLLMLLVPLLASIAGLIPGQSNLALGLETLALGLTTGAIMLRLPINVTAEDGSEPISWKLSRWAIRMASVVPILVAGLSLATEAGGGLYWLVAGIASSIVGAVTGAWVLLVEIMR